jgi:hypothetical protein
MTQKKQYLKTAGFVLAVSTLMFSVPSCIDELYDINNGISMDMALGGDSLSIPIGSTDTIRLGDYLSTEKISMLKTMENGGYGISIDSSMDVAVPEITAPKIDSQIIEKTIPIDFGDINLENFKIDGIDEEKDVSMGLDAYSLGKFEIPPISVDRTTDAGIAKYTLGTPRILDQTAYANRENLLSNISVPPTPGAGQLVDIPDPDPVAVNTTGKIDYSVSVPSGVSDISDIVVEDGAVFEISIELSGATQVLSAGRVVPSFTIDPKDLFVFATPPANGKIVFSAADSMTALNEYKVFKRLDIAGLNISGNPNAAGKLEITKTLTADGTMSLIGARVMSEQLDSIGTMDLLVKVSVSGVVISSMEFKIPPMQASIPSGTTGFSLSNSVPDQIGTINKVNFENPATITIDLSTLGMPAIKNGSVQIDNLVLAFPSQFVFEDQAGLSGSTFTITDETFDPVEGKKIVLTLKELDMSNLPIVNKKITWNPIISYSGQLSFGGRINSKDIPAADAKMNVKFESSLTFKSAEVTTNKISVDIPTVSIPIPINVNIAKEVKRLNTIKMKAGTKIRVDIVKPELPLTFSARNIQIAFPDIFVFSPALPLNVFTIDGPVPDSIVLVLDAISINQDLANGALVMNKSLGLSGGVDLLSGVVNSTEIAALKDKSMHIKATTSDLIISSTSVVLNNLEKTISASQDLILDNIEVPAEIVSLDSILLNDSANIDLSVTITNMPTLSNPVNANVTVDFPDLLLFSAGSVNANNQLVINEPFVNGKLSKNIKLRGLKFDSNDLMNGSLSINKKLNYRAGVSVASSSVNSDDLMGKEISVTVIAKIRNLDFKAVYGKLNPTIKPINETIQLGDINKSLEEDDIDVVLDITKAVIVLNTECNLGIPIDAEIKVTPLISGSSVTSAEQSFTLNIPKAPTVNDHLQTGFWISPDTVGMPAGYHYIVRDIQDLFKRIPDAVQLTAQVTTNKSEQHFFDLDAAYKFKLGYEVIVPFAFGEDFYISINKDITGIDPSIGEMAKRVKGLEVLGSIQNSIPLELQLALIPLDEDGERIAIDTVTQIISAGAHDGSATTSALTLKLKDPQGKLKDLRGFRLIFKACSNSTVAATPLKPENYIKADLKIRVNGPINLSGLIGE